MNRFAVFHIIGASIIIIKAGVIFLPHAVFIEYVDIMRSSVRTLIIMNSCCNISVWFCVIKIIVNAEPPVIQERSCPHIFRARVILDPLAVFQHTVFKCVCVAADSLLPVYGLMSLRFKVIILVLTVGVGNYAPAGFGDTFNCVIRCPIQLKQPGHLALAHTVLVKVVIIGIVLVLIAGDILDAGHDLIVHIVVQVIASLLPALPGGVIQREAVREGLIGGSKVAALFGRAVIRMFLIYIWINSICLLCRFLASHIVQCIGAQIDVIAQVTAVGNGEASVLVPCSVTLGRCLDSTEDNDGVRRIRFNRLRLLIPVADNRQSVGFLIQGRTGPGEVIIDQLQLGIVDVKILIHLEIERNSSILSDTLCQLEEQIPCANIVSVTASNQSQQGLDFFGDRHGGHIQRKDIGDVHCLLRISDMIIGLTICGGVGHITIPCELLIARHGGIKVKDRFAVLIQCDLHRVTDGQILGQLRGDGHHADAGAFVTDERQPVKCAGRTGAQREGNIISANCHKVSVIGCLKRQCHGGAIDGVHAVLREVQSIRHNNLQGLAAIGFAVCHNGDGHITLSYASQNAIRQRCNALVGNDQLCAIRQISSTAGNTDTDSAHVHGSADSQIIGIGGNQCMVKGIGRLSRGDDHQRRTDRTLIAIGGTVDHGYLVCAFFFGSKCGGAAAVQADCGHAASFQHNLRHLNRAAACGEGLLTAIQYHHHDLAVSSNANASTGSAGIVIIRGCSYGQFSIFHQINAAANGLLNPVLVGGVLGRTADNSGAVLQNGKEVLTGNAMILDTLHDQRPLRRTVCHVVEVRIDTHNRRVVFNVSMFGRGRCHLVSHTGHTPGGGVVVLVVGVNLHVVAVDVNRRSIVDNLLIIRRQRIGDVLLHTGSKGRILAGEDGIIGVARLTANLVTCQLPKVVGKGVAAGGAQVAEIRQAAVSLQQGNCVISRICRVNRRTKGALCLAVRKTVLSEVGRTVSVRQRTGKVALHQRTDGLVAGQVGDEIVGIQITAEIIQVKGIHRVIR